jgi:5-methylcytosine-specific restriction endonuclease McrA
VGTSLRMRVFMRDDFTCQYCGRRAPDVELHADHRLPVALGGDNSYANLATACRDCNLGKATMPIATPDQAIRDRVSVLEAWVRDHDTHRKDNAA